MFLDFCRYTQQFMLRFSSASLARFALAPFFARSLHFCHYFVKVPYNKSRERVDGFQNIFAICRYTLSKDLVRFSCSSLAQFALAPLFSLFRLSYTAIPQISRTGRWISKKLLLLYVGYTVRGSGLNAAVPMTIRKSSLQ